MARGNQRDKAREKNQAKLAGAVRLFLSHPLPLKKDLILMLLQKSGNSMTGSEMMRNKDDVAAIMRKKQAAGMLRLLPMGFERKWEVGIETDFLHSRGEEKGRGCCWKEIIHQRIFSGYGDIHLDWGCV